jgi:hypothetical protein
MNFSGNVGKSTLAKHLFLPRLENAEIISFESINSNEDDGEQLRGKQFGDLLKALPMYDNPIIDVGASNVEDFINAMADYVDSHEYFDYFIVPTVSKKKQLQDTIATIETLNGLGVPSKKIITVFNLVDRTDDIEREFTPLFDYHAKTKSFSLKHDAVIHNNELYANIRDSSTTVDDLLNDETNYKELMAAEPDKTKKVALMNKAANKMLAKTVKKELDAVFKAIHKK